MINIATVQIALKITGAVEYLSLKKFRFIVALIISNVLVTYSINLFYSLFIRTITVHIYYDAGQTVQVNSTTEMR